MTATRDRYGEATDEGVAGTTAAPHDPNCQNGWLGEDNDGRLVPCLQCRPHLIGRRERALRRLHIGAD